MELDEQWFLAINCDERSEIEKLRCNENVEKLRIELKLSYTRKPQLHYVVLLLQHFQIISFSYVGTVRWISSVDVWNIKMQINANWNAHW